MSDSQNPTAARLLAYALPALPLAALTLPLYILAPPFYAQTLGLPLALVGDALLAVRLIDAISDPVIGVLADRWRPRFGRRRLWLACASLPTAMAAWFVFVPPADAGLAYLTLWGALLSVGWTAASVPYAAWGAELSTSYAGRARVAAFRETLTVVGTLVALSMQALAPLAGLAGPGGALFALALFCGFGLPLASGLCVALAPEPPDATRKRVGFGEGLSHLCANGPFLRLIAAFFINGCANGFPATLFLFFVGWRLKAEAAAGPLLLVYFLCGVAGVPFWLWLARKWSKHRAWAVGMLVACACFAAAPFLHQGDVGAFAAVCVGTGFALGADLLLAPAIQADVIDIDTARSGEQRAGLFFAIWGFATKLALALAVGLGFPLLAALGFDPAAGAATPRGLEALGWLYAGAPIALKLMAVALMWNFPLDAAAQAQWRAKIAART